MSELEDFARDLARQDDYHEAAWRELEAMLEGCTVDEALYVLAELLRFVMETRKDA